jgi:putative ABC transport system permease protein
MHGAVLDLALRSAVNRKATVLLTVLAIAIGVGAFVTVEKLRQGARAGFERTISGTDLIVGSRTGSINLLLFTVFHIGEVPANVTWESYQEIVAWPEVDWAIPISLGDSYRGYRVVGTDRSFLTRYRFGDGQSPRLAAGEWFDERFDAVVGAEVAATLGLAPGAEITLAHGLRSTDFAEHGNAPFRVSGTLAAAGTPVDRSVFVGLDGIEAMHFGWQNGVRTPLARIADPARLARMDLEPDSVSAIFLGLRSPIDLLRVQRQINGYAAEPLTAVLPGVTLARLWEVVGTTEQVMLAMTALIVLVGLMSILVSLLATLRERRREIAVLRAIGARPTDVFALLIGEAALMALAGSVLGIALVQFAAASLTPLVEARFGLVLTGAGPARLDLLTVTAVTAIGAGLGLVPGWIAYRHSLADGLTVRV